MKIYNICGGDGCCPVVEVGEDTIRIGEDGNRVELERTEWEALKTKIKTGEIQ